MNKALPTLQLTPETAARFARSLHLPITKEQASKWLAHNRDEFEDFFTDHCQDLVEAALYHVTLKEWPDPTFDAMNRSIRQAIDNAISKLESTNNLDLFQQEQNEDDEIRITKRFLRHRGQRPTCAFFTVSLSFVQPGEIDHIRASRWDHSRFPKPEPYIFKLVLERGNVTATITTTDAERRKPSTRSA